jgi:paraquat-inducible protein A
MTIWLTRLAPVALLAALPLLILGWTLPILSVTSFWVMTAEHSVFGGLMTFFADGEWLLLLAIGGFAVVFPAMKIAIGAWAWARPNHASGALKLAHSVSKWSMLDVFVIALVVMTAKSSVVADASVGVGAWCFTGAAIASTLALAGLAKRETLH